MKTQRKYSQEKVPTEVDGVTSGQKGSKRAKRAKKAFLDHIIDQKRLIKGFRLKIGTKKIKNERTTQIQPGKSHHRGSRGHQWPERVKRGKKGQKGLFGPYY